MIRSFHYHAIGKDPLYKTWHSSGEHLLMYIHRGCGSIVGADAICSFDPGTLVFIRADTYHYTLPDKPEQYDRSKLFISNRTLEQLLSLSEDGALFRKFSEKSVVCAPLPPEEAAVVEALLRELSQCDGQLPHQHLLTASHILHLLYGLCRYATQSASASSGFVDAAIRYIGQNIGWDIRIEDICRAINVSKYHFCRCFKASTSMTVMDYILNTRIVLAKNELKKTDQSVMQISEKCGFSSTSYFCRIFRQQEGCTPLQYRKRQPPERN